MDIGDDIGDSDDKFCKYAQSNLFNQLPNGADIGIIRYLGVPKYESLKEEYLKNTIYSTISSPISSPMASLLYHYL